MSRSPVAAAGLDLPGGGHQGASRALSAGTSGPGRLSGARAVTGSPRRDSDGEHRAPLRLHVGLRARRRGFLPRASSWQAASRRPLTPWASCRGRPVAAHAGSSHRGDQGREPSMRTGLNLAGRQRVRPAAPSGLRAYRSLESWPSREWPGMICAPVRDAEAQSSSRPVAGFGRAGDRVGGSGGLDQARDICQRVQQTVIRCVRHGGPWRQRGCGR